MLCIVSQEVHLEHARRRMEMVEAARRRRGERMERLSERLRAVQIADVRRAREVVWKEELQRLREVVAEGQAVFEQVLREGRERAVGVLGAVLEDLVAAHEARRELALERMRKGSFVAEEEYAKLLELEPRLRQAQVRGHV